LLAGQGKLFHNNECYEEPLQYILNLTIFTDALQYCA
jgi:hypothetical protein